MVSKTRGINDEGNSTIEIVDEENDIQMDVEIVPPANEPSSESKEEEKRPNSGKLKIAIFGREDSAMVKAQRAIFNHPLNIVDAYDDIDRLIQSEPQLSIVCAEFNLNVNDTQDDAVLIDAVKKIESQTVGGILLKTVVTPETMSRIMNAIHEKTLNSRFAYAPDLCDSENIDEVLNQDTLIVGAAEGVYQAHIGIMNSNSNMFLKRMKGVSPLDASIIKLSICAYKAVKQTFFNQLYDYISDYELVNYNVIRNSVEDNLEAKAIDSLPSFIKQLANDNTISYKKAKSFKGEYDNKDIKAFVGATEKLTLLDECINYKNLKD